MVVVMKIIVVSPQMMVSLDRTPYVYEEQVLIIFTKIKPIILTITTDIKVFITNIVIIIIFIIMVSEEKVLIIMTQVMIITIIVLMTFK